MRLVDAETERVVGLIVRDGTKYSTEPTALGDGEFWMRIFMPTIEGITHELMAWDLERVPNTQKEEKQND